MLLEALPLGGAAPAKALLELPRGLCAVKGIDKEKEELALLLLLQPSDADFSRK